MNFVFSPVQGQNPSEKSIEESHAHSVEEYAAKATTPQRHGRGHGVAGEEGKTFMRSCSQTVYGTFGQRTARPQPRAIGQNDHGCGIHAGGSSYHVGRQSARRDFEKYAGGGYPTAEGETDVAEAERLRQSGFVEYRRVGL